MEERATSARYVSLVTQWGKKLSEAIHKLRQQEDIISSLKREKFELAEQLEASQSQATRLEQEKAQLVTIHQEEQERLKNELQIQLSRKSDETAKMQLHEAKNQIKLLEAQLKLARKRTSSSQSELSTCSKKVGQLEQKISTLEGELGEAKQGRESVESELQRMKNGMDKLEATFASLDGPLPTGEQEIMDENEQVVEPKSNEEIPPVLETSGVAVAAHAQPEYDDIEVESPQRSRSPSASTFRERGSPSPPRSEERRSRYKSNYRHRSRSYHGADEGEARNGDRVSTLRYGVDERKLECRICKQRFHRLSALKAHLRFDHNKKSVGALGCISCGVPFTTKYQFIQHRREFQ